MIPGIERPQLPESIRSLSASPRRSILCGGARYLRRPCRPSMGITGILRWTNPPLGIPNGLDLVTQRVIEQYGQNVTRKPYQIQIRQHRPTQLLIPNLPQSETSVTNDPQKQQQQPPAPTNLSPENIITAIYPPQSIDARPVVFVQQTRAPKVRPPPGSSHTSEQTAAHLNQTHLEAIGTKPEEMLMLGQGELVPWLQEQGAKGNKYLAYPKVVVDPAGKNVANMTAALFAPTKKARAADPYASSIARPSADGRPTPTLSGGTLHNVEGFRLDISLGGVGMLTAVEWIVRVGWVAGIGTSNGQFGGGSGRGLIIEAEYVPFERVPQASPNANPPGSRGDPDEIPTILREFLLSLLPEAHALSTPPIHRLTRVPSDERWHPCPADHVTPSGEGKGEEGWSGDERARRVAWMLIEGMKEDGVLV